MADVPAYRKKQPDEGHERIAAPLRDAVDALAETVAVIAEQQAALQDSYFLSDLLFELVGQALGDLADCRTERARLEDVTADLAARLAALEPTPPTVS